MIAYIRGHLQTVVFRFVLAILFLSLAITISIPQLLRNDKTEQPWIVRINNSYVTERQLQQYTQLTIAQLRQQLGEYADQLIGQLKANLPVIALNNAINTVLLAGVARHLKLVSSPDLIMQEMLKNAPAGVVDERGAINEEMFMRMFPMFDSMQELQDYMGAQEKQAQIMGIVKGSLYLPEFELKNYFMREWAMRQYSIFELSLKEYLAKEKETALTDASIEQWYKTTGKNYQEYWTPEVRSATVWEFNPQEFGTLIKDQTIEKYYNRNKRDKYVKTPTEVTVRHILFAVPDKDKELEVRERAQKVLQELSKDTAQFAELAKQHSDDKKTASNGGRLKPFSPGEKDKAFERAALRLKKDGDISPLVKTDEGFELIQRIARKDQTYQELSSLKESIRDTLVGERFKDSFTRTVRRMVARKDQSFDDFAQSKKARKRDINSQEKTEDKLLESIFNTTQGRYGIFVENGKGFVVLVTNVTKAAMKPLAQVKNNVREQMYRLRAKDSLESDLKKAKKDGADLSNEELKQKYGFKVEKTGFINGQIADQDAVIKKTGIPAAVLTQMISVSKVNDYMSDSDGYLVKLDKIEPFDEKLFESKKDQIIQLLRGQQSQLLQAGFIASLARNATLEYNEKLKHEYGKRA